MNESELRLELNGLPIQDVRYYKSVASTNDSAAEWLLAGAQNLSLVIADEQTAGRGRMDRKWFSTPGRSLTFSVILKPDPGIAERSLLYSPVGAVAVCSALEVAYQLDAEIKWPNDVLIAGKKVCGVLAEVIWNADLIHGIILGVGINLAKNSIPIDHDLLYAAASVGDFLAQDPAPVTLLKCILQQLVYWEQRIGSHSFFSYWESHLAYKDKDVRIIQKDLPVVQGRLLGVAKDGCLRIELDTGFVKHVAIGDVHLRSGGE